MKKYYEDPDMEIIELLTEDGATVLTLSEEKEGSTGDSRDWGQFF